LYIDQAEQTYSIHIKSFNSQPHDEWANDI